MGIDHDIGAALLVLAGCASSGTNFKWEAVQQIEPGMTPAQVQDLLGEPSHASLVTTPEGAQETWVWSYAKASYFGGIDSKSVSVTFLNGRATEVPVVPSTWTQ